MSQSPVRRWPPLARRVSCLARTACPGRAWTQAHRRWVNGLTWPHPADRIVVDDYLLAIDHLEARLTELDAQLATLATTDPYREPVGWLRCFRGIDTLTAMLLLAELHDVQRLVVEAAWRLVGGRVRLILRDDLLQRQQRQHEVPLHARDTLDP